MTKLIVDACVLINCFQRDAKDRESSSRFIEHLIDAGQMITMPAHGWFEVLCNLNKLSSAEKEFLLPAFKGKMELPLELIHIDKPFIAKYGNVAIPYTKAADHIYIVIAHVNGYPLVTTDKKMYSTCETLKVKVFTPDEYVESMSK